MYHFTQKFRSGWSKNWRGVEPLARTTTGYLYFLIFVLELL